MAYESRSFWEQRPLPRSPISLQHYFRLAGHHCAIAIANMKLERSSVRRCANCRSMRIAGGRPPVTKKVLPRS